MLIVMRCSKIIIYTTHLYKSRTRTTQNIVEKTWSEASSTSLGTPRASNNFSAVILQRGQQEYSWEAREWYGQRAWAVSGRGLLFFYPKVSSTMSKGSYNKPPGNISSSKSNFYMLPLFFYMSISLTFPFSWWKDEKSVLLGVI